MAESRDVNICVLVIVALASVVSGSKPLRCTVCRATHHLAECLETTTCDTTTEVCYIEKVLTSHGIVHVNAGCKSKTDCDSIGCFGESQDDTQVARRVRRADTQVVENVTQLCHHCCDTDFCNMYGCNDTFDLESLNGKRCFNCNMLENMERCNATINCEVNEVCMIDMVPLGGTTYYNSGCISEQFCRLLRTLHLTQNRKRNAGADWTDCCPDHMCNGRVTLDRAPPSFDSISYSCPAKQPPPHNTVGLHSLYGKRCFNCELLENMEQCNRTIYCEANEVCMIEIVPIGGTTYYNSGCISEKMCHMLHIIRQSQRRKRNAEAIWTDCCSDHMCNGRVTLDKVQNTSTTTPRPTMTKATPKTTITITTTRRPTTTSTTSTTTTTTPVPTTTSTTPRPTTTTTTPLTTTSTTTLSSTTTTTTPMATSTTTLSPTTTTTVGHVPCLGCVNTSTYLTGCGIVQCNALTEWCFVTVDDGFVNAGCKSKQLCQTPLTVGRRQKDTKGQSRDVSACSRCCDPAPRCLCNGIYCGLDNYAMIYFLGKANCPGV